MSNDGVSNRATRALGWLYFCWCFSYLGQDVISLVSQWESQIFSMRECCHRSFIFYTM
jgi:hypothetical protein